MNVFHLPHYDGAPILLRTQQDNRAPPLYVGEPAGRPTARCDRPNFLEFSYKFPKNFIARENSVSKSRFF